MHVQYNLVNQPAVHVHVCLLLDAVSIPFSACADLHTLISMYNMYSFTQFITLPNFWYVIQCSRNELNTAYMYITFSASCFKKFAISLKIILKRSHLHTSELISILFQFSRCCFILHIGCPIFSNCLFQ